MIREVAPFGKTCSIRTKRLSPSLKNANALLTTDVTSLMVLIRTKTGVESYILPEKFSGELWLNFNVGGLAGVDKKERLK